MKLENITCNNLTPALQKFWKLSGEKIRLIRDTYDHSNGSPVFTIEGKYTARGWTEWTQGFEYGSALLQFDATNENEFLDYAVKKTVTDMAAHVSHFGVHDHGFNNVSTYGNLLRLMNEGRIPENEWQRNFLELALKISGSVQAKRWTALPNGGYIYSFNGPHSLFADTIRSLRSLSVAHQLGHVISGENDVTVSMLQRVIQHAQTTASFAVYYGDGRDAYDVSGRVAHESIFNTNDGNYRCPNSQQGFSPFTTWIRGLAWIMCGYPEQLEFLRDMDPNLFDVDYDKSEVEAMMLRTARTVCDFYIENTSLDGVPYWDTGAPELHQLGDYRKRASEPFNDFEPVDSSAAAIAAQGLLRLGDYLGRDCDGETYWKAGLTVMNTLLDSPYLSEDNDHQGLLLHSVYHRPNGWDHIPAGQKGPCGESSMWGDYHVREAALYIQRVADGKTPQHFYL